MVLPKERIPGWTPGLSGLVWPLLAGALALAAPPAVGGQEAARAGTLGAAQEEGARCAQGVVTRVDVINHSIFAPYDIEGRRNEWAYELVNRAHIRTRESFLRRQIVVEAGDCYDPVLVNDSERLVRQLNFIARARATAEQQPDGNWVMRLETWDEWTLLVSFNASVEDKFEFEGARLEENNFLGRGSQVFLDTNRFRHRRDTRLKLRTRRLFGTLVEGQFAGGTTRNGHLYEQRINYPFRGERAGFSFDTYVFLYDRDRSYYTGDRFGVSHLLVPVRDLTFAGTLAWRRGEPGERRSFRVDLTGSRPTADGVPRIAVENEYDNLAPAPDSLTAGLGRQTALQSWVRLGVTGGLRHLRFETRQGLDLVFGTQDVAIGWEAELTLGRTLATWGSRDLSTFAAVDLFGSQANEWLVAQTWLRGEAHFLDAEPARGGRWRDASIGGYSIAYAQPSFLPYHTLVARVAYEGAWNFDDFHQLSLGGGDWLRSLVDFEAPVSKRVAARIEDRFRIPGLPPAVDLGLTAFVDWGRGWAGNLPYSKDIPWTMAFGGGFRLALPARSGAAFRIEWAWPADGSGEAVFRVVKERGRTNR